MLLKVRRWVGFLVMALLLVGACVADTIAQRRTKKSRRVTNPVTTAQPAPSPNSSTSSGDPQIISTADDTSYDSGTSSPARRTSSRRNAPPQSPEDATRDKVDKLTAQVSALNEKIGQMEQQQRTLVDLERLSRAETRVETLRAQLRDVQAKEAELQSRALQIEYELQPGVIERTLAVSGSTRPEDLREQRRKQLEAEKNSTQDQISQFAMSRTRLETAIVNAEAEVDRLRARIDTTLEPTVDDPTATENGVPPVSSTAAGDTSYGRP